MLVSTSMKKQQFAAVSRKNNEMDGPWKFILSHFLQQFMELCLPAIADKIDWSKTYKNLNTEFQKLAVSSKNTKRIADMLFSVVMKDGENALVLLHLEIQSQKQDKFSYRMYHYHNLILDLYQKPIVSIALLLDEDPLWCPDCFEKKDLFGKEVYLYFKFYAVKVLRYASKLEELIPQKNIFSLALHYQLMMIKTKEDDRTRFKEKINFTRELFQLGLSREQTKLLFEFLDWILQLPEDLTMNYTKKINETAQEEEWQGWDPVYISSFEKVARIEGLEKGRQEGIKEGIREGIREGIQKGEASLLTRQLKARFQKKVTKKYIQLIEDADSDQLSYWGENLMKAKSIEEVFSCF